MRPYTIDEIRRRITPVAEKYGLPAVYLFGSYARGEAREDSDIDLIVEIRGTSIRGMFALSGLCDELEKALEAPVDLITVGSLEQPTSRKGQLHFRENIRKERVTLYAAA